jgi:RimJ/RimL family protein N-acetyltransferase
MPRIELLSDERVGLTPLETADVELVASWINDQAVIQYQGPPIALGADETRAWLERMRSSDSDQLYGIWLRSEERLIGTIGLHGVRGFGHQGEYGITIGAQDTWGKGYGTEAGRLILDWGFNRLNLHSVFLRAFAANAGGLRSYEKLGFKSCGLLRQAAFRCGTYLDMVYMDILRDEFNALWADWRRDQAKRYGLQADGHLPPS